MTDHNRRVANLENRAARDRYDDADAPVVPEDPTDLPYDAETYFLRALEHTSHTRDLAADVAGVTTDADRETDVGPYPHAAERYQALRRATGDLPPKGEERSVPEHVAENPRFEVNGNA